MPEVVYKPFEPISPMPAKKKNSNPRHKARGIAPSSKTQLPRRNSARSRATPKAAARVKKTRKPAPRSIAPFPSNADHASPAEGEARTRAVFRVQGRMSTFGGPQDFGMKSDEELALFQRADLNDPRHRDLFLPSQPPGTTGLGRRLNPEKAYIACRWDYMVTSRSFLRNTLASVQSVSSGKVASARPADWGPNAKTGRVADLSPSLAALLGLDTNDEVIITIGGEAAEFVRPAAAKIFNGPAGSTEPKVYTTAEWGAAQPNAHFGEAMGVGIVVHNTQGGNREPLTGDAEFSAAREVARSIQRSHMEDRHWADTGQHFTISRGGLILEGRHGSLAAARAGRVVRAAHAESTGGIANRTWFGIEMEGDNRREDLVTSQLYDALVELCAWLMKWRGVLELPIKGHMDVLAGHTDCPGKFEERLAALRNDVAARRAQLG